MNSTTVLVLSLLLLFIYVMINYVPDSVPFYEIINYSSQST